MLHCFSAWFLVLLCLVGCPSIMHCSVMIVYHEVGLVQALLVQWFRLENSTDYGGICECLSVFETGFKVDWLSQYELFLAAQKLWNTCFFFLINLFFLFLCWCDRCSKLQGWVAVSTNLPLSFFLIGVGVLPLPTGLSRAPLYYCNAVVNLWKK